MANRSPYNLRVTQHAELKAAPLARANHYTMSAKVGAGWFLAGIPLRP
jgi:hypothetical protein